METLKALSLTWVRSGNGGRGGTAIRWEDWHAWRMAVVDKERELAELRAAEPCKPNTAISAKEDQGVVKQTVKEQQ